MDPMSNFGPGGLGNEVHLGGTSQSMFPGSSTSYGSPSTGSPDGIGYFRPSLTSRIGAKIFGSAWGRIAATTSWVLRLGGAGLGFHYGGHWMQALQPGAEDGKLFAAGFVGAAVGFVAPILLRAFLPLILFFGAIYYLVFYVFASP